MANFKLGKFQFSFLETATSGGTLALVGSSKQYQILTGISNHIVQLPDATTMGTGLSFIVDNVSTGIITVQLNDAVTILGTVTAGSCTEYFLTNNGSTNGTWRTASGGVSSNAGIGGQGPGAAKTTNYSIITGDKNGVILVDTTSNVVSITLPSPAVGFNITVKDVGGNVEANPITIARSSSSLTIDNEVNDDIINKSFTSISYLSDGTNWFRVSNAGPNISGRGIWGGGQTPSDTAVMDYITIGTLSNATSFGNLSSPAAVSLGACASSTRGIFAGGLVSGTTTTAKIDYITFSTPANSSSFANLTQARLWLAGCSSSTRGVFAAGDSTNSGTYSNVIDYITIQTLANAISFGTVTLARQSTGALSSTTRGIWAGGFNGSTSAVMDYVTIASIGNATSFGNLSLSRTVLAGCSNSVRGLFGGGETGSQVANIDYVTIATTANAINFGNLTQNTSREGACASSIRGVFGGGTNGTQTSVISYVIISILSNATSFGNLTVARQATAACSNVHGGLS